MAFSDFFKKDETTYAAEGIIAYRYDSTKDIEDFVKECLVPFRLAYIRDEQIDRIKKTKGEVRKRKDIIADRLPASGIVMSGDFGEILTFYLATELWAADTNVRPMKWRLKDKKLDPSKYTDIILMKLQDVEKAHDTDRLYTIEVKTLCSRPSSDKCSLVEAVVDAEKDRVSRWYETLEYLRVRCEDMIMDPYYEEMGAKIERFLNPAETTYGKEHLAMAVFDGKWETLQFQHLPKDFMNSHKMIHLFCLPIDALQTIYESVYYQIPHS